MGKRSREEAEPDPGRAPAEEEDAPRRKGTRADEEVEEELQPDPAAAAGVKEEEEGPGKERRGGLEEEDEYDEDDDQPVLAATRQSQRKRSGAECPYLDTISRQNLDFDFEKCCSVSLSPVNVYACLVCGKYFQGRGPATHAHTHALESGHHMFMKLADGRAFCLPDGYEVEDRSLDAIRHVLAPAFTPEQVAELDRDARWVRALDGTEYMPGLVGLNNMKHNDYANAAVQALSRVAPLRAFFLLPANYAACRAPLVQRFGELLRKCWNARAFKGHVSPHEFMQSVMAASGKRFVIERQADPVDFLSWLLNALHGALTGGKRKRPSIITQCFQGELEIRKEGAAGEAAERVPFLMLGLDLPPAPLYKDALEKNIIPQVTIFELLLKFDGKRVHDDIKAGRRTYRITRLPPYLVLHVKRFARNTFFMEKNPTIVNFPVRNLELKDLIPVPLGKDGRPRPSKYDLAVNVVHEGAAGQGTYHVNVHRRADDTWHDIQDLRTVDILSQMVSLSEAYLQIYELQQGPPQPRSGRG